MEGVQEGLASAWAWLFAEPQEAERIDWGRSALRFTTSDEARALIDRERVERWLAHGNLRYPQFSLTFGGEALHPNRYTRAQVVGEHRHTGCADPGRIAAAIGEGATLSLTGIEVWDEHLARLSAELGRALVARVQTVAFLTPPGHFGTRAHRDATHVFVVQAEGSKRWTLYDLPAGDDWDLAEIPGEDAVTEEVELRAGEGLYVPLGMGHRAMAGPEGSLHLSVMVNPPRLREVVQAWAAQVSAAFTGQEHLPIGREGRIEAVGEALRRIQETPVDLGALAAAVESAAPPPDRAAPLPWPAAPGVSGR
ncbi:JmjC domain-containing protein [Nonomuraea sp. CA-218870]|uniref:JmjC domain-containing protein n=1 Tax=Nonomuraea sp. CA-218870 TaxID=3239998 RepID=UPI003D8F9EA8